MGLEISGVQFMSTEAAKKRSNLAASGKNTNLYAQSLYMKDLQAKAENAKSENMYETMGLSIKSKQQQQDKLKPTLNANIFYDETTKKYYQKDATGNLVEMKSANGGQITSVASDGAYWETLVNEDGSTREIRVNSKGLNIQELLTGADGKSTGKIAYKYDSNDKLVSKDTYDENGNFKNVTHYDVETGNKTQYTEFDENGNSTLIEQYDRNTGKIIASHSANNGVTISSVSYDEVTGNKVSNTKYDENGVVTEMEQFDSKTGKLVATYMFENGVNSGTYYYDPETGKKAEYTHFADGKNDYTILYSPETGKKRIYMEFDNTGKSSLINRYNPETEQLQESSVFKDGQNTEIHYYDDTTGNKIKSVYAKDQLNGYTVIYDPETGKRTEYIHKKDGINDVTTYFDRITGKRTKVSYFDENGQIIDYIELKWENGKLKSMFELNVGANDIKELDNGTYVREYAKHKYQLLDADGNPLYDCDKDGNKIEE